MGTLLIAGGGKLGPEIAKRFAELAGGPDAAVVLIPTANERDDYAHGDWPDHDFLLAAGFKNVTLLHTRDRRLADTEQFVAALQKARAVWFSGGRQWRLVDAYLGTRVEKELHALLSRGGVIGGSSAGATIQGSYLVRGAREGNRIMMASGYEKGFGFLKNVAIDQHLIAQKRETDLAPVIAAHPELLGIGIDEKTAIVVRGDRFDVVGPSKVAIYEPGRWYFLEPGQAFSFSTRAPITPR